MLILSRREGEGLTIGDGIRIVVLGHDHRGVRLGIEAPNDVRILRDELMAAVGEENKRAAAVPRAWPEVVPTTGPPKAWQPPAARAAAPGKPWSEIVPLAATPKVTPQIGSANA